METLLNTVLGGVVAVSIAISSGGSLGAGAPAIEAVKDVETYEVVGVAAPAFKAIEAGKQTGF